MNISLKRNALAAVFATTTILAAPLAAQPLDIADVEVIANLGAVDANALDRWPDIAGDLTVAITSGLEDRLSEDGDYHVTVDLNEISNAGATMLADDGEFNQLKGWVYIDGPDSDVPLKKIFIDLSAEEGAAMVPSNVTIVPPKRAEFYDALVVTFAQKVVSDVTELETEWLEPQQADDNS